MEKWYPEIGLNSEQRERIEQKKLALDALRPLPYGVIQRLQSEISLEWTYNSNAIEGNTLSLNETKIVLENGITIGGKSLREHFEVINHQKALEWLETRVQEGTALKTSDILSLHRWVMEHIDTSTAGCIRTGMVRISGANFLPPNPLKVPQLLDELFAWLALNNQELDAVARAAIFHHRMVWIHPFFDGNGRTARLAMNLFLMQLGFPPLVILKVDRQKYYRALNEANKGNFEKLYLLFFQGVEASLDRYLHAVSPESPDDYESLSQIAHDPEVPYGQEYLSLLARRGKIEAFKEGRVWYSTKTAVKRYLNAH